MEWFKLALLMNLLVLPGLVRGQVTENPALNAPDEVNWKLFLEVNARQVGRTPCLKPGPVTATRSRPIPSFLLHQAR